MLWIYPMGKNILLCGQIYWVPVKPSVNNLF